ncbi:alpha/beta fold hydrolase [Thermocatellispora tengchongensis]
MAGLDHRERLARIRQPTLVIQGRHDRKQRYEGAKVLRDLLPDGTLRTFDDSAHMVNVEEIARFNDELRAFVAA